MNDEMMDYLLRGNFGETSDLRERALLAGYITRVGVHPHTWYSLEHEAWYQAHCHRVKRLNDLEKFNAELLAICDAQFVTDTALEAIQKNTREILRLRRMKPYSWKE